MEFSTGFLNKLLDSAIKYHKDHSEAHLLPEKMPNVDRAIKKFSNALVFEAHQTMQNEIISNDLPILHAVNLDGNSPGIISAKSSGENKFFSSQKN